MISDETRAVVIILGYLTVDEADRARFVEAHRDLVMRARAFKGCIDLSISTDPVDPRRINNTEVWESAEALAAWRAEANAPEHGVAILDVWMKKFAATDAGPVF